MKIELESAPGSWKPTQPKRAEENVTPRDDVSITKHSLKIPAVVTAMILLTIPKFTL